MDRERLIEFFTTAQNNFLSGPPRKWVAVWLRTILPTVLYGLQLYFVSNLVIGLICIAAPSSRHYSQLRSTGTSVFHTGGHPRNVLVRVILTGWLGCCVSSDWLAKAGTSMFSCVTYSYFFSSSDCSQDCLPLLWLASEGELWYLFSRVLLRLHGWCIKSRLNRGIIILLCDWPASQHASDQNSITIV